MIKKLCVLLFVGLFIFSTSAQTIELPRLTSWNPKCTAFDDGSYMLELIGKKTEISWERKLMYFSADGKMIAEKTIAPEEHWDFSNSVITIDKDGALRSIIDKDKKICYTLYNSKTQFKITATDIKFQKQETIVNTTLSGKGIETLNNGTNPILSRTYMSYLDENGNPGWIIRSGYDGVAFVKFDVESKKTQLKFIEITGEDYKIIGRQDGKSWIAQWEDFGKKKDSYKLKLISVDEAGNSKIEGSYSLKKKSEIMVSQLLRIQDGDNENAMVFGVAHYDGKVYDGESDIVQQIDFLKVEDGTIKKASWNVGSSMYYNGMPSFIHHETPVGTNRFVVNVGLGGLSIDANFEDGTVSAPKGLELKRVGWAEKETWNILLYLDELTEDQQQTLGNLIQDERNVQFVYKISDSNFIIVLGTHFYADKKEKEKTTVKIY